MNKKRVLIMTAALSCGCVGLLAINGIIKLDPNYPTNRISSTTTGNPLTRWEPSAAAGTTWAHSWLDYILNPYTTLFSTWNGSGWNSPVGLWSPQGNYLFDVNLEWDQTTGRTARFILVARDAPGNVWFGYSTSPFTNWTYVLTPLTAGVNPSGCGAAVWDYPSIGVDGTGRVIVGAVYDTSGTAVCGFWAAATQTDGTTFSSSYHRIGTLSGTASRVVATNNVFHAFVPTLDSNNLPNLIQRWQSSDGVSWTGPNGIGTGSFTHPWNNTPSSALSSPCANTYSSTIIFYAPLLAAKGYTNGLWTVAFEAQNSSCFNNIIICTSDRGCGWANAASDDQFLMGTSVSGDSAYWINYFTYQTAGQRNPPLIMQALYFPSGKGAIGATTSSNLQITSWSYVQNRCVVTPGTGHTSQPCYSMGDFSTIASNSYAATSTPFVCSNTSGPCSAPSALYQDFVEDPQGVSDLVNFAPNYIPIPFGADVTRPASPPGEDSYALPPYQTAGLPIPAGR